MIDFGLSEEEELIRTSARSFASEKLRPHALEHEELSRVKPDVVDAYRQLGFSLLEAPAELGGAGLSTFAKCLVLEELGWGDAGAALAVEGVWPGYYALLESAPKEVQSKLFGELAGSGEPRCALVLDVDGRLQIQNGTVQGSASFVPTASAQTAAVLKEGEILLVDGKGLTFKPLTGCALQATGPSEIQFTDAKILHRAKDPAAYERCAARIRLYTAALLVGVARASLEYAMKYAQERSTFGKPIAHHQGIAFIIADMATAVDAGRLSLWKAVYQLQKGEQIGWHAAAAYQEVGENSRYVTDYGVQLLGGHGYIKDHPVEKWMREAQVLSTIWGGLDQADLDGAELVLAG
ncbi:MAG: acyl-CoA/acyl-ACP dehydrogenase [Nitrospirae bacterium]|nr:acyl-CoA/acyl-ACP dehydrogenase [Nitrospirota bacterium]